MSLVSNKHSNCFIKFIQHTKKKTKKNQGSHRYVEITFKSFSRDFPRVIRLIQGVKINKFSTLLCTKTIIVDIHKIFSKGKDLYWLPHLWLLELLPFIINFLSLLLPAKARAMPTWSEIVIFFFLWIAFTWDLSFMEKL